MCRFHKGGWLEIVKITVEVDVLLPRAFCSHIKAKKIRGRREARWLCFSQRGSQRSHTSVAVRRIQNVTGDSDRGEEREKKDEMGVGMAG